MNHSKLNILTIDELRKLEFPGSELKIEKKIVDIAGYENFTASYYSEGLKIYGYLMLPKGPSTSSGWPVIIFNRGYVPEDEFQSKRQYVRYMAYLVKAGYVVFKSDYRGHGESEGPVENLIESGYATDVLNAIASVKKLPNINTNRIGIWGHSLGGDVSLKVMLVSKDIKAGVIWGAPSGSYLELIKRWSDREILSKLPEKDRKRRLEMLEQVITGLGNPNEKTNIYYAISPVSYIRELEVPLQLHHVISDDKVPVKNSEDLYNKLKGMGKNVELFLYKEGDHNFSGPELEVAMRRSIKFFDQYLK